MAKKIETYTDTIRKNIEGYDGELAEVIKYAPDFYELFESLAEEKGLNQKVRSIVNSVIVYFVLPSDVIPESEYGAFGYVDDVYLCAYAVGKIATDKTEKKLIKSYWKQKDDVFDIAAFIRNAVENASDDIITKEELELVRSYIEPKVRDYDLLHEKISPHILMHLSHKAKYNNMLTGELRALLYKFSKLKMDGYQLSEKQKIFFENILLKAIDEGIINAECGENPCFKCEKLKEINFNKKYTAA
jgi:uncharacterized membrane protein YkvA (DUF1232 family)